MPKQATFISLLLHIAAMVLLFLLGYSIPPLVREPSLFRDVVPLTSRFIRAPRGGGGDRTREKPRQGRPPARPMRRVFAPTMPRIEEPKLPMEVAMLDAPDAVVPYTEIGDPFSRFPSGTSGRNGLLGIGSNQGRGVGDGPGDSARLGVVGATQQKITRPPQVLYHPEPEYSEQARKARFQGSVLLSVIVGADGIPSQIRVQRGAGFGLDEKAIEAVARWRFRPAISGDRPVAAPALVQVFFHLL